MSFIQLSTDVKPQRSYANAVMSEGEKTSKLCFIGECPGRTELRTGKPFSGDSGSIFDHCLHAAGLIRGQQYITTFVKEMPSPTLKAYVSDHGILSEKGLYWQKKLSEELENVQADILIPMGNASLAALVGETGITKRRGYLTTSLPMFCSRPVLPSISPASCSYGGNYIHKYYITHDMQKAARITDAIPSLPFDPTECVFPTEIWEIAQILLEMHEAGVVSFDIEVANYEISAISFSATPSKSYSILFKDENLWTAEEEREIWVMLAELLESPTVIKVGQNLIFDINFLQVHQHIFLKGGIIDTMIGHHLIYPDFLKGLGFLGSIYTHRPYWKDMVSFKNIKKES